MDSLSSAGSGVGLPLLTTLNIRIEGRPEAAMISVALYAAVKAMAMLL